MFENAASFDGDISGWNVSKATNMTDMFKGATDFDQNLGPWYVVPDDATVPVVDRAALPGNVATLSAQNGFLDGHDPTYGIGTGGDRNFEMSGTGLRMENVTAGQNSYAVNVTATGQRVFEDGNNWRIIPVMLVSGADFITTWQATDDDKTITIPVGDSGASYDIDWGDGNTGTNVTGSQTHNYTDTDNYTVTITGGFERIRLNGGTSGTQEQDNAQQLLSIDQWGRSSWTGMAGAFAGASSMVYRAVDAPDLSRVTLMSKMFEGAASFDGDVSGWDTSRVTDMSHMFEGAASFDGDVSGWDTSRVTDMSHMFEGAASFDGDVSGWDTSRVTDMSHMFEGAASFDGDVSGWDTSRVTDMSHMFEGAASFDGDVSGWDVSNATDMTDMFNGTLSFRQNLGPWYVVPTAPPS